MVAPLETKGGGLAKDMTLRDWYKGQAIIGVMLNFSSNGWSNPNVYQFQKFAEAADALASALIERERGE